MAAGNEEWVIHFRSELGTLVPPSHTPVEDQFQFLQMDEFQMKISINSEASSQSNAAPSLTKLEDD